MEEEKRKSLLLLIDIQYDFLPPDGSLAVSGGDEILPVVYRLVEKGRWDLLAASQDYHPPRHISFASRHGKAPFTKITLNRESKTTQLEKGDGETFEQELWPDHCVQGTRGAEIERGLYDRLSMKGVGQSRILRKGEDVDVDEYSAFQGGALYKRGTPEATSRTLARWVQENDTTDLFVCGLATDYCVRFSVLEALKDLLDYDVKVYVLTDAVKGVDPVQSERVLKELESKGAILVDSNSEAVSEWMEQ